MKKSIMLSAMLLMATFSQAQDLTNLRDSLSYAIGLLLGENIKTQGLTDLNLDLVNQAFAQEMQGGETKMDKNTANQVFRFEVGKVKEAVEKKARKEGEDFLKKNAERKEVVKTPSGLQYEILKEGTGPIPTASNKVNVHYHGTLINGDVFDSSVQRGEPISFPVTGVIKGWVEALQMMPVGSKWKLFIPSDLAYGARGAGGKIGPHAALIFEVELLGIE